MFKDYFENARPIDLDEVYRNPSGSSGDISHKEIIVLNDWLQRCSVYYCSETNRREENVLTANSTLEELAVFFSCKERVELAFQERRQFSPDWTNTLRDEIWNYENRQGDFFSTNIIKQICWYMEKGFNPCLYAEASHFNEIIEEFLENFKDDQLMKVMIEYLEDCGFAVALAHNMPHLQIELEEREAKNLPQGLRLSRKIKWLAGPSFLGHLMDDLVRNGYMELPFGQNNERNAEFLLEVFEYKDSKKSTLAIELSEISNHLTPDNKARIIIRNNPKKKTS